ncbi:ATP-binding protein [Ancylobacter sp. A5.8]|uniref:sensor histidine kinase n=1 Tax=Ancylobacter gelatini TaxID=2919920 RepID=UPI001F4E386B|nr:ATP-binding protein [Ancylobacter gelatini]MCJ8142849.1 ATP-binding protein [Ancylobacter gelatini]
MRRHLLSAARLSVSSTSSSPLAPTLALVLGAGIFLVDTLTPLDMAVAVLYVAVVMLLADRLSRPGILLVGAACIALTLISFLVTHHVPDDPEAALRALVSLSAIAVATVLSLRNRQSNESLRSQAALLDLTHDAVLVRNAEDIILYWNRGAEELYGWSAAEAVGRKTSELLQTTFPVSREAAQAQLLDEARWEGELRHTRKDGSHLVVSSRWSLRHDERGLPAAAMETNNDITARKRSEDALHRAHSELAHVTRVATLGQLTASIAHEVNQPLAAVVTNGEACLRWLRRPEPDVPEAVATVERMIANGRRASEVIARLRALARGDDPEHMPLHLDETVEEALMLMDWERTRNGVVLALDMPAGLPQVIGDKVQLQQVIINLVMNAVQAMEHSPAPRILTVRAGVEHGLAQAMVQLEVSDTGDGIAPEQLAKLFEPFHSTKPNGMGLGLSISRSIIEAHAGRIQAEPGVERGMTFLLALPAVKETTS